MPDHLCRQVLPALPVVHAVMEPADEIKTDPIVGPTAIVCPYHRCTHDPILDADPTIPDIVGFDWTQYDFVKFQFRASFVQDWIEAWQHRETLEYIAIKFILNRRSKREDPVFLDEAVHLHLSLFLLSLIFYSLLRLVSHLEDRGLRFDCKFIPCP
jgi:hypothetical protein